MLVSCNMPKKVRVGRSAFCLFLTSSFLPKEMLWANRRKNWFAKKIVKNCKNSVFRVINVNKKCFRANKKKAFLPLSIKKIVSPDPKINYDKVEIKWNFGSLENLNLKLYFYRNRKIKWLKSGEFKQNQGGLREAGAFLPSDAPFHTFYLKKSNKLFSFYFRCCPFERMLQYRAIYNRRHSNRP